MSDPLHQARLLAEVLRGSGLEWLPVAGPPPLPIGHDTSLSVASATPEPSTRFVPLQTLAATVQRCQQCKQLYATRTQTVFGEGPLNPAVLLLGDAPRTDDDRTGIPFQGETGELLTKMLAAIGVDLDDTYRCLALKCRPPGNRQASASEFSNCRGYLEQQLQLVQPRTILCLGASASQTLLQREESILELREQSHSYHGVPVICTFHPAYLLKQESAKKQAWEDLKRLKALLDA